MESEQDIFMKEFKRFRQLDVNSNEFKNSIISIQEPNLDILKPKVFIFYFIKTLFPDSLIFIFFFKEINLNLNDSSQYLINYYGLKELKEWKCYELIDNPGLYLISNPFKNGFQQFFIKKCLNEYHNLPNKTNLDLHMKRDCNLWESCVK